MLLRDVGDPIACWLDAERYLGTGTRTYSEFAGDLDISDEYHPQLGRPSFTVPSYRVPPELGSYLTNGIPSSLSGLFRAGDDLLLPVHPDALAELDGRAELDRCAAGPGFEVVPTANGRTVFVRRIGGEPVPPHFVKLHYPRRLSRFVRRLRRSAIELQLWVADELARVGAPVLPEVGGGVFEPDEKTAWGFVVREALPTRRHTVPLFALYGKDFRSPGDPTLLEQLVLASGEPAGTFLAERVVGPMVRLWVSVARSTGCSLELHGQNTLFEFTVDGRDTAIAYRDCAVYVDGAARERLDPAGALPPTNVVPRDVPMPVGAVFSLTYDSFMGHHALDYLAALAADRFGVPPAWLHAAARAAYASASAGAVLLPATTHAYDDRLYADGTWRLVDTGSAPTWR